MKKLLSFLDNNDNAAMIFGLGIILAITLFGIVMGVFAAYWIAVMFS